METTHAHPPVQGKMKSITQTISLVVGFILCWIAGAALPLPSFAGLHMSIFHGVIMFIAGATLIYNGWKDNDRYAFLACLGFGVYFGVNSLLGFMFGSPGEATVGLTGPDPMLVQIIPRFAEMGTVDHVMNGIIAVVLLGGALDWWNVHRERKGLNRHDRRRERFDRLAHR